MPSIEFQRICKTFARRNQDSVVALDQLDLGIGHGELLAIMGPTGCGKSTALRILSGLERPDSGEILIEERPVTGRSPHDRNLSLVVQGENLFPHLTVYENLLFGARSAARDRVERVTETLGLGRWLNRFPQELSGGQRQSVAVGRSLIRAAPIALYDEPLAHLDAVTRRSLRLQIRQFQWQESQTVVYVTHDQTEAMAIADRIALMHQGTVIQVDSPARLYREPVHRLCAEWIGNPPMNLWEADWRGGQLSSGSWTAAITPPFPLADGRYLWGIRPEMMRENHNDPLAWQGTVALQEFQGDRVVLGVQTAVGLQMATRPCHEAVPIGTSVTVSADSSDLYAFDIQSGLRVQSPLRA